MAVPVMKKTGKEKGKGKQVEVTVEKRDSHPSSSSPPLMVNNNGKGKQVQVFVDNPLPLPLQESSSSSSSAPAPLPQFPPGYRFAPEESELIIDYLHKKVVGKPIDYHPNPVVERDLYGNEEPSQICHALGKAEHEDLYVFTLLRSKPGGTHMSRRAGNGTWKGDHKAKDCYDDMGTLIGCRTTLTFFHNMTKRTSWIMHQYTLPGQHQGWTLCRIHNEDQAKKKSKCSATTYAPQHPIPSSSPQSIIHDDPVPAAKRPRTDIQTPSSSQTTQTPLQSLPSDVFATGFLSSLLDDDDVDPVLEFSHTTTTAQNALYNLASFLGISSTDLASSSSHPPQDFPSSSQHQGPDPFACDDNDWSFWLIDDNILPF